MQRILIANRGEVARRIICACRKLGLPTAAIYSGADRGSLHAAEADTAIFLPGASAEETYLNQQAVIAAARSCGADAIHPGFGFLAENDSFAGLCAASGIKFIGPSVETLRIAGDKGAARAAAQAAGAPVIPGYNGEDNSAEKLAAEAESIGWPVLIKAAAGGGGKGMRRIENKSQFAAAVDSARREAGRAFASDRLIIERDVSPARHIEVQLLGDGAGNIIHLFERECSFQRRFQKIIEESPAPELADELRSDILAAAISIGRAIILENAATVEFLLPLKPAKGQPRFYFIEVNPRLQVEHPVTELRTGLDIVGLQIEIARGKLLADLTGAVAARGHAIEARLYAEVPEDGFLPAVGTVRWFQLPPHTEFGPPTETGGLRIDHALVQGLVISPSYDPMIGKIIAAGNDRKAAIKALKAALSSTVVSGVDNNIPFLSRALDLKVPLDTGYLDRSGEVQTAAPSLPLASEEIAAAIIAARAAAAVCSQASDPFFQTPQWRDTGESLLENQTTIESRPLKLSAQHPVRLLTVEQTEAGLRCAVESGGKRIELAIKPAAGTAGQPFTAEIKLGKKTALLLLMPADHPIGLLRPHSEALCGACHIFGYDIRYVIEPGPKFLRAGGAVGQDGSIESIIRAPLPGTVSAIKVAPGDEVEPGQVLAVIESMKMEHPVSSPLKGTVASVTTAAGTQIRDGDELVHLIPKK